jgi:ATP-dependent Lon protease
MTAFGILNKKNEKDYKKTRLAQLLRMNLRSGNKYVAMNDNEPESDSDYEYDESTDEYETENGNEYTDAEIQYYNKLTPEHQATLDRLENELNAMESDEIPIRFKILESNLEDSIKRIIIRKLNMFADMGTSDSEYVKMSNWLDGVMRIPFGTYASPFTKGLDNTQKAEICNVLENTRIKLSQKVYGHNLVKDHIVRILAKWISNPTGKGIVIGIQGSHGCGKTTLVKEGICNSLNLPFVFLPLGGMADRAEFVGHSYTYEGSKWGKIVNSLMQAKCMNPIMFFDELDKVSETKLGNEITHVLMQITDPSQNESFHDSFYSDFTFDLSRCIMIFSYNDESKISPILRDRMIRIRTDGYSLKDKYEICQLHLIPEILAEYNMDAKSIVFSNEILSAMINKIETEDGVRNIKRAIHDIVSNIHLDLLMGTIDSAVIQVTDAHIKKYILLPGTDKTSMNMMYM